MLSTHNPAPAQTDWEHLASIASSIMEMHEQLAQLAEELATRTSRHQEHREDIGQALDKLAQASALQHSSEVSLAHCAHRSEIGRLVGTTTPRGFYTDRLGFSTSHANALKFAAEKAYGKIDIVEYEDVEDETSNQRSTRMRFAKNKFNQEKFAQRQCRAASRQVSIDQLRVIDSETRHLNATSLPGLHKVRLEAIEQAQAGRNCVDLKQWCRQRVIQANYHPDAHSTPHRRKATRKSAHSKRSFTPPKELPNGMMNFGVTTDSASAAAIIARRQQATRIWKARQADSDLKEERTLSQFIHDYFMSILIGSPTAHSAHKPSENPQVSSVDQHQYGQDVSAQLVIVATMDDFLNMGPQSRFHTDTGAELSPAEIMRVGLKECFIALTDEKKAELIDAGRVRSINRIQRAFLTASQLVCSHPGCSEPAAGCEGHHLTAYSQGGKTDFDNLTLLCPYHHRANNDRHDGAKNMGHMTKDPDTGDIGKYDPSTKSVIVNDTLAAQQAPGRRVRHHTSAKPRRGDHTSSAPSTKQPEAETPQAA